MQLTDYVLTASEKVVKRAKIIKTQLIESQKYIKDCGGGEMRVTTVWRNSEQWDLRRI
jgi:hypothetical protein